MEPWFISDLLEKTDDKYLMKHLMITHDYEQIKKECLYTKITVNKIDVTDLLIKKIKLLKTLLRKSSHKTLHGLYIRDMDML